MNGALLTAQLSAATVRMDLVLSGLKEGLPEALDDCAKLMELTCQELIGGISAARSSHHASRDAGALAAALELRAKIRQARRLLENVYRFHTGWNRLLGARAGGYLPDGQAAAFPGTGRLCLRG